MDVLNEGKISGYEITTTTKINKRMFSLIIITFTHRFLGEIADKEGDVVIQEGLAHVEHAH